MQQTIFTLPHTPFGRDTYQANIGSSTGLGINPVGEYNMTFGNYLEEKVLPIETCQEK